MEVGEHFFASLEQSTERAVHHDTGEFEAAVCWKDSIVVSKGVWVALNIVRRKGKIFLGQFHVIATAICQTDDRDS